MSGQQPDSQDGNIHLESHLEATNADMKVCETANDDAKPTELKESGLPENKG